MTAWSGYVLSGLLGVLLFAPGTPNAQSILNETTLRALEEARGREQAAIDQAAQANNPTSINLNSVDLTGQLGQLSQMVTSGEVNINSAAQTLSQLTGASPALVQQGIQLINGGNLSPQQVSQALNLDIQGYAPTAQNILGLAENGLTNLATNALGQSGQGFVSLVTQYTGDALGAITAGGTPNASTVINAIQDFSGLNLTSADFGSLPSIPGLSNLNLPGGTAALTNAQGFYNSIVGVASGPQAAALPGIIQSFQTGNIDLQTFSGLTNALNIDPNGVGSQLLNIFNGAGGNTPNATALISQVGSLVGFGGSYLTDAQNIIGAFSSGNITSGLASALSSQALQGILPGGAAGILTQGLSAVSGLAQFQNVDWSNPIAAASALQGIISNPAISGALQSVLGLSSGLGLQGLAGSASNILGLIGGQFGVDLGSVFTSGQFAGILQQIPGLSNFSISSLTGFLNSSGLLNGLTGSGLTSQLLNQFGISNLASSFGSSGFGYDCGSCLIGHYMAHSQTRSHFDQELQATQQWILTTFFNQNLLPAMMSMANQLSATAMKQVEMVGMFLDAKHQLETQRLFQQLQAQAHKDYQPSEGMCTIGTNVRSLASSERYADYSTLVIANRTMQRQLLSGEGLSREGPVSDMESRLDRFKNAYCDPRDNNGSLTDATAGLGLLCQNQNATAPIRKNKDVDYTRTIETALTLDMDFAVGNEADTGAGPATYEEEDVFSLASNLYANETLPRIDSDNLANTDNEDRPVVAQRYLDLRSVAAKRSVAQNSFAAIAGMRTSGAEEVQPFLYAVVNELGLNLDEITEMMGARPSYFAQMEVLTKKLYQNPNFYADLYDKPANVERKAAALQAIALMQDRDIYRSLLRSEAALSVLLETKLLEEQERVNSKITSLTKGNSQTQGGGGAP